MLIYVSRGLAVVVMSKQIGVRMNLDLINTLKEVLRLRGENLSDLVRRAVKMELARGFHSSTRRKRRLWVFWSPSDKEIDPMHEEGSGPR